MNRYPISTLWRQNSLVLFSLYNIWLLRPSISWSEELSIGRRKGPSGPWKMGGPNLSLFALTSLWGDGRGFFLCAVTVLYFISLDGSLFFVPFVLMLRSSFFLSCLFTFAVGNAWTFSLGSGYKLKINDFQVSILFYGIKNSYGLMMLN